MADSYAPTKTMQTEAQRGLDWRQEFNRGGTEVGVARARDIVNGRALSLDTVKRMASYFARHEVDKEGQGWSPDQEGYPSAGRVAWALWGGDPGRAWALAIITESEGRSVDPEETERMSETTEEAMSLEDTNTVEEAVEPRAMMTPVETRKVNGREVEFRMMSVALELEERSLDDMDDDQPVKFVGYAAVFDSPSERLWDPRHGEFVETVARSAFNRTLAAKREVRMYVNHNSDMVLSSTRSGTLDLTVDERGLRVESILPDTTYARDLEALMRAGVVDSMSFGFSIPTGGDTWSADGSSRELREIILHEVSVVTGFPAYPDTVGASVRSGDPEDEAGEQDEPVIGVPVMLARRMSDLYAKKA